MIHIAFFRYFLAPKSLSFSCFLCLNINKKSCFSTVVAKQLCHSLFHCAVSFNIPSIHVNFWKKQLIHSEKSWNAKKSSFTIRSKTTLFEVLCSNFELLVSIRRSLKRWAQPSTRLERACFGSSTWILCLRRNRWSSPWMCNEPLLK